MMMTTPEFTSAVNAALEKLVPGEQTKEAVKLLMNKYGEKLRDIALMPQGKKVRTQQLDAVEGVLFAALEQLADTEHDQREQPEQRGEQPAQVDQPQPDQPQPAPIESVEPKQTKRRRPE